MTLQYRTIHTVLAAQDRLRGRRRWLTSERSGDQLTVFTLGSEAAAHSQANWQWCSELAQRAGAEIMVMQTNGVQFLGRGLAQDLGHWITPPEWLQEWEEWNDSTWHSHQDQWHRTDRGQCLTKRFWRHMLCMPDQRGVWHLSTGRRLRSRSDIVDLFWLHGFATRRGHVPGVADPRLGGSRRELEALKQMANIMSDRERHSEVALKICRLFRSVRRQVQWPGCM